MIGPLRNRTLAISVVAVLQLAALGYMVWDREMRVRNGTDVVLEVIPVDPRSLFQGDYVILGYPISRVPTFYGTEDAVGKDLYVSVVKGADGNWVYGHHAFEGPQAVAPGGVVIKGRVVGVTQGTEQTQQMGELRVVYELEKYFVPEGKGRDLEALVRDKKLSAIVSVWRDGSSTLKGLMSEGKVLYQTGVAAKRPEDAPPLDGQQAAPVAVEAMPEPIVPPAQEAPVVDAPAAEAPSASPPAAAN